MDCRIGADTRARIAAVWHIMLDDMASGALVERTHTKHGLSRGEIRAYLATTAGARQEWDEAREASADAFMDEAVDIAFNYSLDAADARARADILKWAARVRNPRLYGDRAALDVNVRTVDLTRIIEAANARLASAVGGRVLEHGARLALPALVELAPELESLM